MRTDGGPAFPGATDAIAKGGAEGMCLRDYFAIRLMDSIVKSNGVWTGPKAEKERLSAARAAYDYADAMLKARQ